MKRVDLEQCHSHTVLDVALVRAVPHSTLDRGREREAHTQKKQP